MHPTILIASLLSAAAIAVPTNPNHDQSKRQTDNKGLIKDLLLAPTAKDRIALIPDDKDLKFSFAEPPAGAEVMGKGGKAVSANRGTFPGLIGTGVGMTVGFLSGCGFNTPHIHPRSSEILIVVEGNLETQFTLENGARTVQNSLGLHEMTVFPQGSMHTQFNPGCEPMVFVAGFASEDPGTQQTAQTFFGLNEEVTKAAIGNGFNFEGKDVDTFRSLIPANIALGVEQCLKTCNIQKRSL